MLRRQFLQGCLVIAAGLAIPEIPVRAAVGKKMKFRSLTAVPIRNVKLNDGFWSPKMALWRETTFADCFTKFEESGALANFDRVAAGKTGEHKGDPWWDGLIYEMITAASDFLIAHPDPKLDAQIDGYIARIAAAAAVDPDGYINTAVTLRNVAPRWSDPPAVGDMHDDRYPHTVYNAGCLVEAAVHHYRATGKTSLLKVATRMANTMCRIMGPPPRQNIVPGHAISELAFVELYQLFHETPSLKQQVASSVDEKQYLELAEFWIENRGDHTGRVSMEAYDQDDQSVFKQPVLEGHAVRAALLAAGMARAAAVNHKPEYQETLRRWWDNMVEARMYVTGGLGAIPTHEGFGADYELPNTGYAETCAAVAGGQFSEYLGMLTGRAEYFDVLERELYNGALAGVSLDGTSYFYTNYLMSNPDRRRWSWHTCPCCPPMFLKMMGALPGSVYATGPDGLYVNLLVGSRATIAQDGLNVTVQQTSGYPWDGNVRLTVTPRNESRFAVNVRVPGWCRGAKVRVNGEPAETTSVQGYTRIDRTWNAGDTIEINLPMTVRRVKADPRVAADVGHVALMRGPIVYCLEGVDNGGRVGQLVIPASASIKAEHRKDFLGGVTVLQGQGKMVRGRTTAGAAVDERSLAPATFTAVPFYTNTNREPTEMAVWIADQPEHAEPLTLAGLAIPTASHCFESDTVWAMNGVQEPKSSDDESLPRFTWWDHRGTSEWAQYDFPSAQRVCAVEVYWWDEARLHRDCRVPQSWELQYRDGDTWKPVQTSSTYGTEVDTYNRVTFTPVNTTALRIVAQSQPGWSAGILRWRVLAP